MNRKSTLADIMNIVLDGFVIADDQGIIRAVNKNILTMFGYELRELIGLRVKELMPEPYYSKHDQYLKNSLNGKSKNEFMTLKDLSGKRKDGRIFPINICMNQLKMDDDIMFAATIRDMTAEKNHEKIMKDYIKVLKNSNQELDDFAHIASHDLKEPLRGLSNHSLFLKEDYESVLDADGIKKIDRMIYLCKQMEKLISDLFYFSKIRNQKLAIKEVDLNEIIENIKSMIENTLIEKNVKIFIPQKLPHIICDGLRITEVFRNLIVNAIKYNDKKEKHITIGIVDSELRNKRDPFIFYVKDNGIGILEEYYSDIFRIFKRLNNESDELKGTGVGLTFVKKIIERHSGEIWLKSEFGQGTTFYFTIGEHILYEKT